jgi:four helix bundle protein
MLKNFRAYQLSVGFYQSCQKTRLPGFLKNQLLRASSSISLNLAEGSAKPVGKDRLRFYLIAFGSLRECQAVLDLNPQLNGLCAEASRLGGCLYRLCHPL